jgi:biopolymer transport protein ExbD
VNFYPRKRRSPQVIIVSMIDIFAILLIFVIVTTTFKTPEKKQPSVTIKLPESKTAAPASDPKAASMVLSTSASEEIFLDGEPVTLEKVPALIRERLAKNPGQGFALRADEKISYGFLIRLLDALKEGGLQGNLSAFTEAKK